MAGPKYDPEHALVLCRQHGYRPGLVLLYERKRLYREALQVRALGGMGARVHVCARPQRKGRPGRAGAASGGRCHDR